MRLRGFGYVVILLSFVASGCSVSRTGELYRNPDYGPADLGFYQLGMPSLPELPASDWFNAPPSIVDSLGGKVVLFDFWDYTCVNCIRTIPYLKEWYRRYSKYGLVIIGVHTPEFQFAGKRADLAEAVRRFGIRYPVVMDNDYGLWKEFGNEAWPEEYLFGREGLLRYKHIGEGEYGNTEQMIQKLLQEKNPGLRLPSLMAPVRPTDARGAVCYIPTRETYLGSGRGRIGNEEGYKENALVDYRKPRSISHGKFYLEGKWEIRDQYVRYAGKIGKGKLLLSYAAASVNLVVRRDYRAIDSTEKSAPIRVYVYLDGTPVPAQDRPSAMETGNGGRTYITVTDPGMYDIITSRKFGRHLLTLEPASDAFAAYSFTFGTACVTPSDSLDTG